MSSPARSSGALIGALFLAALPGAAVAQACVPDSTPDWISSVPLASSSVHPRPADCATVEQSPPDLSWPDLSPDASYVVTLTYPSGQTRSRGTALNGINWDEVLPAGNYTWQVQATNAGDVQQSRVRRFTVDAAAVAFVVPDWTVLFNAASAKPRPRALPDPQTAQLMLEQRAAEFGWMRALVDSRLADPVQPEPVPGPVAVISAQVRDECRRTLEATMAWLTSSRQDHLADAVRRALNLAAWDPQGVTSYANVDEAAREIAWTLALAYDWLYPWIDEGQRSTLRAPLLARATDMYNDLLGGRPRIAVHPYDSHGNQTLTVLAAIVTLLAGDVPEAQVGVRDALPVAIHWTTPWGGEDGAFANGTAYAQWVTGDMLIAWNVLRWVTGVDLAGKAWVRNYARNLAYFLPPGTPSGAFGDGAEQQLSENWARFGKAYTLFAPSPLGRWYASQLSGEDRLRLEWLLAPPADPAPAPFPAGTPDSALFASTGWVALHSSLEDQARTSIYFKSSPYGSYNHSHADQNSFVVNAGGRALAIDSGHYDGYGTPHWWQWYKQTRAHNAITFDGGQGQAVFEYGGQLGRGAISVFERHAAHDIVTGDATEAYGGALSEAKRSLVYLRPNHVVVYDRLASATARRWEWNIHALNVISVLSANKIEIANTGQRLCVEMLGGPVAQFAQTDQFTANPAGGAQQWHGTFSSVETSAAAEFVALLNVGCGAVTASATKTDGVWTVQVNSRTVTIDATGGISVAP